MFLAVSGPLVPMVMDAADRARLGALIKARRERKYGTKKSAYVAAQVNAATWDKAESGESVRPDLLRQIVATLWPETEGDWTEIDTAAGTEAGAQVALEERVAALERLIAELVHGPAPQPARNDEKDVRSGETA